MTTVPCTFWKDLGKRHFGGCTHDCASKVYGTRPAIVVCLRQCPLYEGPERTPELIGLTVSAAKRSKPDPIKQAAEWLRHEQQLLIQGPVAETVHDHRHQCCTGLTIEGVRVSPACESFKSDGDDTTGFCESCGCGSRERARIGGNGTKLHCPTYACPRKVWGPMPGTGPQSLGERAAQVTAVIRAAGAEVWNRLFPDSES